MDDQRKGGKQPGNWEIGTGDGEGESNVYRSEVNIARRDVLIFIVAGGSVESKHCGALTLLLILEPPGP